MPAAKKYRNTKALLNIVVIAIIALMFLPGCKSDDERARILHNQAITANREGRTDEGRKLLAEIVAKYPSTQTAVEANQALAAGEFVDATTRDLRLKSVDQALKLYYLDNGRLPSTEQGLNALVSPPTTEPIPRNWRAGGYVDGPKSIANLGKYESDGRSYTISKP